MASLNLGQDVANKRERKWSAAHIVAKSYPLLLAVGMRRYGSLINMNPSGSMHWTVVLLGTSRQAAVYERGWC